jgi:hemerythrin-like metal-binding protein
MTIKWNDRLTVDGGVIDGDHKTMIAVTNQFLAVKDNASKAELGAILADLEYYARSHFWRESQLQYKIGFPGADRQSEEHIKLVLELAGVAIRYYHAHGPDEISDVVDEISALLHGWLIDHILQSDIEMVAYRKDIARVSATMKPLDIGVVDPGLRTIGSELIYGLEIDGGIIDDDHRHLMEIINGFILAVSEDVEEVQLKRTFETLSSYAGSHFSREEELQAAVGYPLAGAHHEAHRELMIKLASYDLLVTSRLNLSKAKRELCMFLKDWLLNHIGKQDAKMRPYVVKMRGAAKQFQPMQMVMLWQRG